MKLVSTLLISIGSFSLIFILCVWLISNSCGFIEDPKLICYLVPDPSLAAALIGGTVFGWGKNFLNSTFGFMVAILGLLVVWVSGFASIYFGSNFWYGFMQLVPGAVIFTLVTSIAASAISSHFSKS